MELTSFKITKKQLSILNGLSGLNKQRLIYHKPEKYNQYVPYWTLEVQPTGTKVKKFSLASVDKLKKLGMVRVRFVKGEPKTTTITESGRNYLKSLKVQDEARLDKDKLYAVHKLVYGTIKPQKGRKYNEV